jgi:predicted alpha/beta-fold hydrolase
MIKKSTLIIIAKDDPIICYKEIPNSNNLPDCVELEIHEHGGHVGFISGGINSPYLWINQRVMRHLSEYLPLDVHV